MQFYIDLVFYNSILKCYVLIDLKLGELTYQDIGQMDGYVRMFEEKFRRNDDNPIIGLLLCSKKNEAVAKYSVLNEAKATDAAADTSALEAEIDALVYRLYGLTADEIAVVEGCK